MAAWPLRPAAALLLAAAAVLGGCATYRARPLHPAAAARRLEARRLDDPRLLAFIARDLRRRGPIRWDLRALTAAALYLRPTMPLARATLRLARGRALTAGEWPNPVLGLTPTYNATLPTPSPWNVGGVVTALLRTAGKRPAAMAEARARIAVARQVLRQAAWRLRASVRTALIGLWAAREQVRLGARDAGAASEMAGLVAARYRAGMVSRASVIAARLRATRAGLGEAAAQRRARLAEARLAVAVGVPVAALQAVRIDMAGLTRLSPPRHLRALGAVALTRSPPVLAALDRYAAGQQALRLAIARQYPDLTIGPGYRYDQGNDKFILAVSLPLPVFNQNQGPIATARAARAVAAARFARTQARVLAAIGIATADWRASLSEARRTRRLVALARHAARADRAAFRAGQIGGLRRAGAALAQARTERGALPARIHERRALGRLEDALHHPFIDTVRQ